MRISLQSAAPSAPILFTWAVCLITFTFLPPCRGLFSQARFIEQIKKTSSKWIKTVHARYRGFSWQRGHGAFSVSPSQLEGVLRYVKEQPERHRTHTFQEEYRALLRKHGIDFDERYSLGLNVP
jgi:hypothetical protein